MKISTHNQVFQSSICHTKHWAMFRYLSKLFTKRVTDGNRFKIRKRTKTVWVNRSITILGIKRAIWKVYTSWRSERLPETKYGDKAKRKGSRRMFLEAIPCVFSGESCLSSRRRRLLYYQPLSPPELLLTTPFILSSLTFPTSTTMAAERSYYKSTVTIKWNDWRFQRIIEQLYRKCSSKYVTKTS